jgi:phenylacetate-CoA ligase
MAVSEYWNPKAETASRDELEALQLIKLRRLCEWAAARSPWYRDSFRRAGFDPEQLKTLADLRRIPMLTREDWMASQAEHPPFGRLPVSGTEAAIRYHTTSGTTGREPLRALDSAKDWTWQAEMWCYGLWGFGVRPADIGYVAFGYGSFIGFWGLHYGLEKLGALNIPGGAQTTENRVKQIVGFGSTVVASTPTYALRLAQEAEKLGIDLAASPVERLILSGEPAGSIPQTKALIERLWGAKAGDTAGMTEIGTIMVFECSRQPGGTHIIEDHFIEEVVDPASGEPVAHGEQGERVVTSFGRGIMPLLRYRSADLVRKVPASSCTCGRTFDLYEGGILGRVDDMKLVRGTNVYPRAVEGVVREFPAIEEFQLLLTRDQHHLDHIVLRAELPPGASDDSWVQIRDGLAKALAEAHEGLRFEVERADPGALPRFELKARRTVDQRDKPIGA